MSNLVWRRTLPFYKKSIDLAKEKVQEEIVHLKQKGVNVSEIESKKVVTENKIEELDKRLEVLPNVREELVSKYREEKEMQLKINDNKDYTEERKAENFMLFDIVKKQKFEKEIITIFIENEQEKINRKR